MPLRLAITLFFLLSGATGLVYQVLWVRMLAGVLGHSVIAISLVVAIFMGGLGLGARLAGRRAQRVARPLLAYGLLEAAIGGLALLSPHLVHAGAGLFAMLANGGSHVFGVVLVSVLVLLPPTTAMGATLPMLTRWYARDERTLGRDMGWLYAVNTTGAVLGAGLAGFVLLPAMGQPATLTLAATINLAVAVGAMVLGRRHPLAPSRPAAAAAPTEPALPPATSPSIAARWVLVAFAVSGAAALANQVAWSRSFELFTGSTTYSFSLIVCAFIAGLAVGGHVFAQRVDAAADKVSLLAGLNLGIALSGAALIPLLGELPLLLMAPLGKLLGSFAWAQAFVFAVLFALVFLPTCLMGGTYPVAVRVLAEGPDDAPEAVGQAYGWNTAGAVVGALATGLVLIPWLGLRGSLWLAVAANLLAAALLLGPRRPIAWLLPLLGVAGLFLSPGWNPRHMNLAPHMYAADVAGDPEALEALASGGSVVFHEEGMGATVTVLQRPEGARVLRINGKTDASTESDRLGQGLLGHLPLLLAAKQESVMMIGLGSGMSLASALSHPVEHLRVVELLPEVHRAARHFGEILGAPLDDPRTQMVIGDGRQALLYGDQRYDAIISQPTNLFVSGVSTLFTVEFFAAMRGSLRPGGVAAVWLHSYLLPGEDFRTICRTFQEVFPEASLWNAGPFDYFLVAGQEPLTLDQQVLAQRISGTRWGRAGQWTRLHQLVDLQRHFLLDSDSLRELAGSGRVQHDRDPFLEFSVPRGLYGGEALLDVPALLARRDLLPLAGAGEDLAAQLQQRRAALRPLELALLGGDLDAVEAAAIGDPEHPFLRERQARLLHARALELVAEGDFLGAGRLALRVTELAPDSLPAWRIRAMLLEQRGNIDAAVSLLQQARGNQPWNVYAHLELGRYLQQLGRSKAAEKSFDEVRRLDPDLL
jgi:spermidine synthase